MNFSQVSNKLSCHIQIYLAPVIILSDDIPDVVFCNTSNNIEQNICKKWMWVTYVTKTRSYTHHKFVTIVKSQKSYLSHSYSIFCILWYRLEICVAWHVQHGVTRKIHCYICNVRTDITNKVQRKRLPEKYFKYRTIQKNGLPDCKILIFKTTMWDVYTFLKKWITWIHCYICSIYHSQCNEPKLTLNSHYAIFLNILMWKELWSIQLPIWSVERSEIYSVEKGRVRRICNRDAVTYVTCYIHILNVNENFPPSLNIYVNSSLSRIFLK